MRILYFDCFNGASGDMILGALLDAGVPLEGLRTALGSLAIDGYDIAADRVLRAGVSATKFRVIEGATAKSSHARHHHEEHDHGHSHEHASSPADPKPQKHHHPHRSLPEIAALIDRSALAPAGKDRAKALFERLAVAEAAIHQMPVEKVHLHEVGALDSIIDIVGAVYALDSLSVDRVIVSSVAMLKTSKNIKAYGRTSRNRFEGVKPPMSYAFRCFGVA